MFIVELLYCGFSETNFLSSSKRLRRGWQVFSSGFDVRRLACSTKGLDDFNMLSDTGIDVQIDYVPFPNKREALTAEMIGGTGGYDIASAMDQWVGSLDNLLEPIDAGIASQGADLAA